MELFSEALPEVRFPDLDLGVLEAAADDLRAAQVELEQIEAELASARAALQAQADLHAARPASPGLCSRFRGDDPALAERVREVGRRTATCASECRPQAPRPPIQARRRR